MARLVRSEDFVECFVFPLEEPVDAEQFHSRFDEIAHFVESRSKDYIWHRDALLLHERFRRNGVSLGDDAEDNLSHVRGVCHFGDNVEDEWFVVHLMKELSEKFHDLVIKMIDSDGEFLLIEAADSLPSWAEPSNTTNRVFFYRGSVLLLPLDEDEEDLTVTEALKMIKSNPKRCLASAEVKRDIFQRIANYPDTIKDSLHRTTVYVPVGVAALLKKEPALISAAVHAFCTRDPIDLKACRAMKYFPPENRVKTSVTFTKCLYAMLLHNNYHPDRRTGWNIPLLNSPQYKSHSLGVKLACGFEIITSQAKPSDSLESNKEWLAYIESLKKRNYFQDLLEGSSQYERLLQNAKDYFSNNLQSVKSTPVLATKILNLLKEINTDENLFHENEAFLPEDDNDDWLSVDPKELEEMLQKRYGKKNFFTLDGNVNPSKMTGKIGEFLEHMSEYDGAEFPDEGNANAPTRPKRGVKKNKKPIESDNSRSPSLTRKYIDFDADQFSGALKNILDFVIPEDEFNSESDLSDYGSETEMEKDIFDLKCEDKKTDRELIEYMKEMDQQLAGTSLGESFETVEKPDGSHGIDVEKNTYVNILKSFKDEAGGSGPAGNILGPLGFTKVDRLEFPES